MRGRQFNAGGYLNVKPLQRLTIRPSINFASLADLETNETFFTGYILRTQANLQFTRELSLRLVTQYNGFDDRLDVEPLLSYRLNPFSIFYVGSTHGFDAFDAPYGRVQSERQLFFKFQYLFRR